MNQLVLWHKQKFAGIHTLLHCFLVAFLVKVWSCWVANSDCMIVLQHCLSSCRLQLPLQECASTQLVSLTISGGSGFFWLHRQTNSCMLQFTPQPCSIATNVWFSLLMVPFHPQVDLMFFVLFDLRKILRRKAWSLPLAYCLLLSWAPHICRVSGCFLQEWWHNWVRLEQKLAPVHPLCLVGSKAETIAFMDLDNLHQMLIVHLDVGFIHF